MRKTTSDCPNFYHTNKFVLSALVHAMLFFSGRTPLHWSACEFHLEVCRLLLQNGANVVAKENK